MLLSCCRYYEKRTLCEFFGQYLTQPLSEISNQQDTEKIDSQLHIMSYFHGNPCNSKMSSSLAAVG